jgi:hypothetical protein
MRAMARHDALVVGKRRGPEGLEPGALPTVSGFPVDLGHHRGGQALPLLRRQVLPAGEGSELQGLAGRVLVEPEVFPPPASAVLLRAVEPPAFETGSLQGFQSPSPASSLQEGGTWNRRVVRLCLLACMIAPYRACLIRAASFERVRPTSEPARGKS